MDAVSQRIADWFETLEPGSLDIITSIYAADASFADPFNEVQGIEAIRRVYVHMFATLGRPRFVINEVVGTAPQVFMTWDFVVPRARGEMTIRGATHFRFAADGRICMHRDYWDTAGELYAKLPLLGLLVRALRRRLAAPAPD
jgi:steroid delta-isomerase